MNAYEKMEAPERQSLLKELMARYEMEKAKGLRLNMMRGVPAPEQLDLCSDMMGILDNSAASAAQGGDYRNYGLFDGVPGAKRLMADILELDESEVFIGGVSSLNLMHDCMGFAFIHGVPGGDKPWCKNEMIKFLCPVPGYDRHFAVTGHFGIEMIPVPMTADGPDMDMVEKLAGEDDAIKGMWCVPKYSNPQGITYSDETVRRLAGLTPKAKDFRIFWDNAYAVHDLYPDNPDILLSLMVELKKTGRQDMAFLFASTSKISFAGAGISCVGCSENNMKWLKGHMSLQTIGNDKLNQLRHVLFFKDINGIKAHMRKHAALLEPKFAIVKSNLDAELGGLDIAQWGNPNGGYFISLDVLPGCAKRIVELLNGVGVTMTPAGATWPKGNDFEDKNIRIAPTAQKLVDLDAASRLIGLCTKIAVLEKLS